MGRTEHPKSEGIYLPFLELTSSAAPNLGFMCRYLIDESDIALTNTRSGNNCFSSEDTLEPQTSQRAKVFMSKLAYRQMRKIAPYSANA